MMAHETDQPSSSRSSLSSWSLLRSSNVVFKLEFGCCCCPGVNVVVVDIVIGIVVTVVAVIVVAIAVVVDSRLDFIFSHRFL